MNKVEVWLVEGSGADEVEHSVVIEVADFGSADLPEFFQNHLVEFRQEAAKAVAASMIDYDSFGSDSAYLDRRDRIADTLYLYDLSVPNTVQRQYDIEGIYPYDGGIWGDTESGCCLGDAEFHGLWTMSINCGYDVSDNIGKGLSPDEDVDRLLSCMDDQELTGMCIPSRPKGKDAAVILRNLMALAKNAPEQELRAAVTASGGEFIRLLEEEVSDEIVELPTTPDAAPTAR
jgi:hypothetical protein